MQTMRSSTLVAIGILVGLLVIIYVKEASYNSRVVLARTVEHRGKRPGTGGADRQVSGNSDHAKHLEGDIDEAGIDEFVTQTDLETTTSQMHISSTTAEENADTHDAIERILAEELNRKLKEDSEQETVAKTEEIDRENYINKGSYVTESEPITTTVSYDNNATGNSLLDAEAGDEMKYIEIRENAELDVVKEIAADAQTIKHEYSNILPSMNQVALEDEAIDSQKELDYNGETILNRDSHLPVNEINDDINKVDNELREIKENDARQDAEQNFPSMNNDEINRTNMEANVFQETLNENKNVLKDDGINHPHLIRMALQPNLDQYLDKGVYKVNDDEKPFLPSFQEDDVVQPNSPNPNNNELNVNHNDININNNNLNLNNNDMKHTGVNDNVQSIIRGGVDAKLASGSTDVKEQIQMLVRKYSTTSNETDLPRQNDTYTQRLRNKLVQTGRFDLFASNKCKKRLPDAIIIGVMKAGTEAFSTFLGLHPQVAMQFGYNSMAFFSSPQYQNGIEWYRERMMCSTSEQITMEKSPQYFSSPVAPPRMHAMDPEIKLIVLVREPIARALSHFLQQKSSHPERLEAPTFEECVFDKQTNSLRENSPYIQQSMYSVILKRWLLYFPYKQMLFVDGDTFKKNPTRSLSKTENFLGVNHSISRDRLYFNEEKGFYCLKINSTISEDLAMSCFGDEKGRTHPAIEPVVLNALNRFFTPYNKEFMKMTNMNMDW